MENIHVIDVLPGKAYENSACAYSSARTECHSCKISWLEQNYSRGLKVKSILCDNGCNRGMIEYIPGEFSWRPIEAEGYIFIHCLFTGFKKGSNREEYGKILIAQCINEAKKLKKKGVAVITRKNSVITDSEIFLNNGFNIIETSEPGFELLVKKFHKKSVNPKFKNNWNINLIKYTRGLTIVREDLCSHTQKNIDEISETSEKIFGITPKVVLNKIFDHPSESPCGFGSFSILYNGEVLSYHPISSNRFKNIMSSII